MMTTPHIPGSTHGLTVLDRPSGPCWAPAGSDWTLGTRGIGWVLYIPEGTNSNSQVRSDQQTLPAPRHAGDTVSWHWPTVVSESGRSHEVGVTITLTATTSTLTCSLHLDNASTATVDSALFPNIAGITLPADRTLTALTRDYYGAREHPLWPTFGWTKAYYGTLRPTLMTDSLVFGNPTAPFAVMFDGQQAIAAYTNGPSAEITSWMWDLDPGYSDTIGDHAAATDPTDAAVLRFCGVHLLDLPPGENRDLTSITLRHAQGGWQQALLDYRDTRTQLAAAEPSLPTPPWAAIPHSWYQVQLNSPVGERRFTFADLPDLARDCLGAGVAVLHVIGWNTGGQDRNNPCHDPDPALGGAEGLASAIKACQDLGVKVVLFTKFTWADQSSDRFRTELIHSAVRDPYGDYYRNAGYQYLTPHQLLDVSTRRLIPMCYLHEEYLQTCEAEFDKVIAVGADGMLFDETMHHSPALLCYAENHDHRPGASVYGGDRTLAQRLRGRLPADRQDFLFAGETVYEDLQPEYHMSYIRSHYEQHQPLTRYINPKLRMLTTVSGFDDRNQINQGLVYGYLYCYEPRHFKGRLTDFPATTAYGRRADTLRGELSDYLWNGTYLGDAPLTTTMATPHATATWTTPNGQALHLLANYDLTASAEVHSDLALTEFRLLDGPWQPATDSIAIPPRSLGIFR